MLAITRIYTFSIIKREIYLKFRNLTNLHKDEMETDTWKISFLNLKKKILFISS